MGVRDSIRAYNGVIAYINKHNIDLGKPKKKSRRAVDEHLNSVWREFGKEFNLEMSKNNRPGYKGSFSPQMYNCIVIQDNWSDFKKWVEKYPKK